MGEEQLQNAGRPAALYIIIGVVVALAVILPIVLIWFKRFRKKNTSVLGGQISREKLKSDIILAAIQDGVFIVAADSSIQIANPAAAKILDWKQSDLIGLDHRLVLKLVNDKSEAIKDENNPIIKAMNARAAIRNDQLYLLTKSQKKLSLSISVSPLLDSKGQVSAAVVIFRDVSEERKEQQRRAEFISTASHEMRTPVAAIEGYLALALNENVSKVDAKAKEYLTKAHSSTQHLGKLFQDLLTSAKAEDGRLQSFPAVVEMGSFVEKLVDDLKFAAQKKQLGVEFIVGAPQSVIDASNPNAKIIRPLYYIYVDPDRIREVITNLFDNAVKYTDSGKITIGITGDNQVVQIRVSDTGPGIASQDIPHLFDKFYRIDNSMTRNVGGTGLGLFICRKIVELYNGRIWVDSILNKGSTFYINIPRLTTQKATELQRKEAAYGPLGNPSQVVSGKLQI